MIDREIGALDSPSLLSEGEQKFTYARYNEPVQAESEDPQRLPRLDDLRLVPELIARGSAYADRAARREHLHPR